MWGKIEKILKRKNWTAYRLAKESGVSKQQLSQLKLGKCKTLTFESVCKIADALGVSTDELR